MQIKIELPKIPEEEMTPTVKALLDIISQLIRINSRQAIQIQLLKDEIARLKGNNSKPNIKPSKMDSDLNRNKKINSNIKRPGSGKRKKTKKLKIDKTEKIHPEDIPEGSKFLGYKDYIVQDIIFQRNFSKNVW